MSDLATTGGDSALPSVPASSDHEYLTTMHVTADIVGALRLSKHELGSMFTDRATRQPLPADEVQRQLRAMLDNGYRCVPTCDNCDNIGMCRGHPKRPLVDAAGEEIKPGVLVDIQDYERGIVLWVEHDSRRRKKSDRFIVVADRCDITDYWRDQQAWDWMQRCTVAELTVVGVPA